LPMAPSSGNDRAARIVQPSAWMSLRRL
jgi:hypothetical protein